MRRTIAISEDTPLEIKEQIGMKQKERGNKKPVLETLSGDDPIRTTGEWAKKERVIDRKNDKYFEHVEHAETGEVIHRCEEPLSKHFGHGSAKTKKPRQDEGDAKEPNA